MFFWRDCGYLAWRRCVSSDYLKGVTENIMLCQLAPIGTGGCTLFQWPVSAWRNNVASDESDFRASPIDTNASFSPYVWHMALSPVPSQGYSQYSGGYSPSPSSETVTTPFLHRTLLYHQFILLFLKHTLLHHCLMLLLQHHIAQQVQFTHHNSILHPDEPNLLTNSFILTHNSNLQSFIS
jgi:hypothetical protein